MEYSIQEFCFSGERLLRLSTGLSYGLLFIVRGNAFLSGSGEKYRLGTEELAICRPGTCSNLYCSGEEDRIFLWVLLSPALMQQISSEKTHVRTGFDIAPYRVAVIRPGSKTLMLMKNLLRQLMGIQREPEAYCADLMEESSVKMFVALVLRSCASQDRYVKRRGSTFSLDAVFSYIHSHLGENLSLSQLEKVFFVSRSFLTREFKEHTGQTVHRYIVKVRLDHCKKLLEQGYSSAEIYCIAGFYSYNHYFKAFKQEYGMTPGEYVKSLSPPESK
ncbi:MAG: helix-turn-helix domain-containing protein [Candidatus Limivicinus sp.]|jgi:AraC-like DNA-binding protein